MLIKIPSEWIGLHNNMRPFFLMIFFGSFAEGKVSAFYYPKIGLSLTREGQTMLTDNWIEATICK